MKRFLFGLLFTFVALCANALIYSVTVPFGTKACYIAGEMNGWKHLRMTKVDGNHYSVEIANATTTQKYKYSSGPSWGYVEKDAKGNEIDNRSYTASDVVASWTAIYDKSVKNENLVFNVTVPKETKCCYLSGGWDGWMTFKKMTKIDKTHYQAIVKTNRLMKYNYYAGPGKGYIEVGSDNMWKGDRAYSRHDVVLKWAGEYDKSVPDADITYSVVVPEGTNSCFIAGWWDNWSNFKEMKKVDATHFTVTFRSNKALKYIFLSGPDWKYVETDPAKPQMYVREYTAEDLVVGWKEVYPQAKE